MKFKTKNTNRAAARSVGALSLMICTCLAAIAQSGGSFVIKRSVIAGGGGNSTASPFIMNGTVGQPYGPGSTNGGTFSLGSGFWAGGTANASPSPTPAISGSITYANAIGAPSLRFVSNVLLTGIGSSNVMATTGAPGPTEGQYLLTGFGSGSYSVTPTKTGGLNAITSFDAAKIAQHVASTSSLTGNQLIVADVSGNGVISSFDAGQIARYVTSSPPFGSTGTWRFTPVNRTYASVNSSVVGEDYGALLMGEVSGNWNNTGARPVGSWQSEGRSNKLEAGNKIVVDMPRMAASTDNEIVIPVGIQGAADKGIVSYEFDLGYDAAVIQPYQQPIDLSGTVSSSMSFAVNANEPGRLRVAVYGATPIENNGVLLNLRFDAVGSGQSISPLRLERLMFNEGETSASVVGGQIRLVSPTTAGAEIIGRVLAPTGHGVPKARVTLTDTAGESRAAVSNSFGVYRVAGLQIGETYTITVESHGRRFAPVTVSVVSQMTNADVIADQ